ncbi:MAG: aldehyde dehydrogenase EutE [Oscillospiraceae bacterium]
MYDKALQELVAQTVIEVLKREGTVQAPCSVQGCGNESGIFSDIDEAIEAASKAQKIYMKEPLSKRREMIAAVREGLLPEVEAIAKLAVSEGKMGRVDHRILKNKLAIEKTPGVEDLKSIAWTGDDGLSLVELSPFGVIGAITPVTNPTETVINNTIGMLAGGNAVVFAPHPSAVRSTVWLVKKINEILKGVGAQPNLVVTMDNADMESVSKMMKHPKVNMLVATGGPGVVKTVLSSGKKAIGAGAGNPPVIVDATANIEQAAKDIVAGASFDNNLPCIAEKEVFVEEQVADFLIFNMQKNNALLLTKQEDINKLAKTVLTAKGDINKECVGKDAVVLLDMAGINYKGSPILIICEVPNEHPFIQVELMMPILGIVRCKSFNECLERAIAAEGGRRHTAEMHSKNIDHLTEAARELQTTIFVKNAPCYAGIGFNGEGYTTFTIAGPTGEGLTSAKDFVRVRRCVLGGGFYIR